MKAIRHLRPGDVRYEPDAALEKQSDGVLVELRLAALSETDYDLYDGREPDARYPVVAGTCAVGQVVEVPAEGSHAGRPVGQETVVSFQARLRRSRTPPPGSRVLLFPIQPCGRCSSCGAGLYDECEHPRRAGVEVAGYLQERFYCSPLDLLPIPEAVDDGPAAFAYDAAAVLRAFQLLDLSERRHLLIFGAGVRGMLAARIALRSGVQPILVDPVQPRLELARQLQIARVINPFAAHLGDDLLYATGGEQADAVIDTAGSEDALAPLADAVAPETPVAICAADPHSSIPTSAILRKRLTVYGAQPRRDDYREALQLMPRLHSDLRALVSSRVELSVVPETIALAARNRESYLKLLVRP